MMKDNDVIAVIFSKEQVRRCKLAHFLKQFGRDALPQGPALDDLMNRFRFLVDGYDDDPQELYAIPEVRKFYCVFIADDDELVRTIPTRVGITLCFHLV